MADPNVAPSLVKAKGSARRKLPKLPTKQDLAGIRRRAVEHGHRPTARGTMATWRKNQAGRAAGKKLPKPPSGRPTGSAKTPSPRFKVSPIEKGPERVEHLPISKTPANPTPGMSYLQGKKPKPGMPTKRKAVGSSR